MSIEDYALELGVDTKTVISKLKELGFKYNNDDDILDDEAIIMLDNELTGEKENNLTEELASKFELEDRAEEAALAYNIELDEEVKVKEKIKKKDSNKQSNDDLSQKKKNIYKNKSKLQSNKEEVESNVVLYKEVDSVCDEDYIIREKDGNIVVFKLNNEGREICSLHLSHLYINGSML